jgi:hypothetical protein
LARSKVDSPAIIARRTFQECLLRGREDPVSFARDFLDFEPHAGQVAWLRRSGDPHVSENLRVPKPAAEQSNLHAANRWGKTESIAISLLHRAFYQIRPSDYAYDNAGRLKPYVVVNVAMSLDQAMIAWSRAVAFAKNSPKFARFVSDEQGTPFPRLQLSNQGVGANKVVSEIWARSTAKGARFLLGKNFNFLSWDECAFEPDGQDILNRVIRMRLADQRGELELISAPAGKGWFYEQCERGRDYLNERGEIISNPTIYTQRGVTYDNYNPNTGKPNIDFEYVRGQEKTMPEEHRKQNIYGEFANISSVFDITSVLACTRDQDYYHLFSDGGLRPDAEWSLVESEIDNYGKPYRIKDHHDRHLKYVMGVDLARKRDNTAIIVLRIPDNKVESAQLVFFELLAGTSWTKQFDRIKEIYYRYHCCPTLIDSTAMGGDMALEALQNEGLNVSGYNMAGGVEKDNLLFGLQAAIQDQRIKFPPIMPLVDQLIHYQFKDRNIDTDAVMGLALAWRHALEHGMGEPVEPYQLFVPDLGPVCVSSDFSGNKTITGLEPEKEKRSDWPKRATEDDEDEFEALFQFKYAGQVLV